MFCLLNQRFTPSGAMNRVVGLTLLAILCLALLEALLPPLLALAHAVVPVLIVAAIAAVVLRVVWCFTNRYR